MTLMSCSKTTHTRLKSMLGKLYSSPNICRQNLLLTGPQSRKLGQRPEKAGGTQKFHQFTNWFNPFSKAFCIKIKLCILTQKGAASDYWMHKCSRLGPG